MVPKSGRIKKSAIEIMSKMMQTFTLSYTDSNRIGPAFFVLFTDFSRNKNGQDSDDNFSYDDETPGEEKK